MFEGLRKKFSDAIKGFVKKEEKIVETVQQPEQPKIEENVVVQAQRTEIQEEKKADQAVEPAKERTIEKPKETAKPKVENVRKDVPKEPARHEPQKVEIKDTKREPAPSKPTEKKAEDSLVKLSFTTKIKKVFMSSVILNEQEIETLLSTLRISMLESDVTFDVVENFAVDLGNRLRDKRMNSRDINKEVTENVRGALLDILNKGAPTFDLMQLVKEKKEKPLVILFLGPNGTGKTTTIAKITSRLKTSGLTAVLSASDTFRAAAIEQIDHHAKKLGVPIIKSVYGADPASIAFDAVAYGRAHRADSVLIDSAGRQETNASLIKEVEKMVRVAKPDVTIFVGESTAGNAIANQIVEFSKHIKIDGIVLTKLDCDAKGGSALSISYLTGIPILFFGIGEGYDALMDYDPLKITDVIMPAAS